ncbi:uncharacterized protein LOC119734949 [Patiria miniata]|uniref:C2H2-type domain-containing protein n=1 Tax=Patiria miniata TaxID=46514 RepID=A0A914ALR5_PATMI|nr:uncharacterized protein LOC119734949 [Patiria miniata]
MEVTPGLSELKGNLGIDTIHRWMKAPTKRNGTSKIYQGLIDAKVPAKRNDKRKENVNEHYYSARVKYARQACSKFPGCSLMFSVDNKNKLRVSSCTPAVDRRCKVSRYFPSDDSPNLYDHDFPTPGYLITPAGYMQMAPPSPPQMTADKLGRPSLRLPECNAINVVNRGPHTKTTIASHCNDLFPLIQRSKKTCITILADGGADFNVNHLTNEWFLMHLFKDLDLDMLLGTTFCPGFSARNPIEHVWGVLTSAATSIYLPDRLPGELPPTLQHLTGNALRQKEGQVFDAALTTLEGYWSDVRYSNVPIVVSHKSSEVEAHPYTDDEYSRVHKLLTGPYRDIKQARDIHDDMAFFKRHIDRRVGMVIFTKCQPPDVCDHCAISPPKNPEALAMYRAFPSPAPSPAHPDHFMSFVEAISQPQVPPDEHMPVVQEKQLGRCSLCRYVYTSETNKKDHRKIFHPR